MTGLARVRMHLFGQWSKAEPVGGNLGALVEEFPFQPGSRPLFLYRHRRGALLPWFAFAHHPRPLTPARAVLAVGRRAAVCRRTVPWIGGFGQLGGDIAAVAYALAPILTSVSRSPAEAGGPRLRRLGHRQRTHEMAEVVGERMKLKADSVAGERLAWLAAPQNHAPL